MNGIRGEQEYVRKIPCKKTRYADEAANVAELLMSDKSAFIIDADFLIDGGATASCFYGKLKPKARE